MGRTYRKDKQWKRDRRDQNFKKSKKFKEFKHGGFQSPKPKSDSPPESESTEIDDPINS